MDEENIDYQVDFDEENHPAVKELRKLYQSDQLSQDVYSNFVFKLKKLHMAFSQSCATEQTLLRRTRELNKELKAQKTTIQNTAAQQQEHRTALTMLRQFVTNIQAELDTTNEQTVSTKSNTELKLREAEKLARKLDRARDDQRVKLEPQKKQIQKENEELEQLIIDKRKRINELSSLNNELVEKITKADSVIAEYDQLKKNEKQKMLEIGSNPISLRLKAKAAEALHNTLLSEEKQVNIMLQQLEGQLQQYDTSIHDSETEYQHIGNDIDGMSTALSEFKFKTSSLETKFDEQKHIKILRDNEKKRVLKQIDEKSLESSVLRSKLDFLGKDINKKIKESEKLDEAITKVVLEQKALQSQQETLKNDKVTEISRKNKLQSDLDRTMKEREEAFRQLAHSESLNMELIEEIKNSRLDKDRKQLIHDQLSAKEQELLQQLTEASIIRDRKAREMASMMKKTSDAKELAKERNLDYLDLCRKLEISHLSMSDTSKLYEQVKVERNRNINTIQTSRQLIVELREKIRILESETEVLRKEFEQTDAQVRVQKNELNQAFSRRNATKSDLKTAENSYHEFESKIDFQANETERLNIILQNIEFEIISQQKRYSNHADDCADRRRMLIDKQDALCILYEQFKRHEEAMKRGEIELKKREDDMRVLELQLKDFKRQIELMQRKVPQVMAYNKEIEELRNQISKYKVEVDDITRKLEQPNEQERKRTYCGRDFTLEELEEKVSKYEQRINSKEQQLWEKRILLREIKEKINEAENETQRGDDKINKIVARSGQFRANSMALRRKKMAALSEMAVYEAQKSEFQEAQKDIKNEIEQAIKRTQEGESFDEYADKMLKMHQRDISTSQSRRVSKFDELDDLDEMPKPGRTHFDAYPTADGLSRPYGAFPVFQPTSPPGHLRHFKKETERPIIL